MDDATPLAFDRIADRYDATRGGEARGERVAAELAGWLVPGPVLEVGVGTGVVAAALHRRGVPVFGVDLSSAMLARAAERLGPGRLAIADARRLPIVDAGVSTVVFVAALHVVGGVAAALAEAARVLRPGGRVLAVHGPTSDEPIDVFEAVEPLAPLRSARVDIAPAVLAAAEPAGLRVVRQEPITPVTAQVTPRRFIEGVRGRIWSWLWSDDEEDLRVRSEEAIARLEALPDPDRPREFAQRYLMTVLARPA